jgi:hypothetical protein
LRLRQADERRADYCRQKQWQSESNNLPRDFGRCDKFIGPTARGKLIQHAGLAVWQNQPFNGKQRRQLLKRVSALKVFIFYYLYYYFV